MALMRVPTHSVGLATVTTRPVREFVVNVIVVHFFHRAIPVDFSHMAVAFVQIVVAQQLALVTTRPVHAEAIHGIAKQWRVGVATTLVGNTLPGIAVVMILLILRVAPALIDWQAGNRIEPNVGIRDIGMPRRVRLGDHARD